MFWKATAGAADNESAVYAVVCKQDGPSGMMVPSRAFFYFLFCHRIFA